MSVLPENDTPDAWQECCRCGEAHCEKWVDRNGPEGLAFVPIHDKCLDQLRVEKEAAHAANPVPDTCQKVHFTCPGGSGESMWANRTSGDENNGTGELWNHPVLDYPGNPKHGDTIRWAGGTKTRLAEYVEVVGRAEAE